MKKVTLSLFLFIGIIAVALYLLNWFFIHTSPVQPVRNENIPVTAVWAGGADGGSWIDCYQIDSIKNLFYCTVYNDFTGEIEFKGKMRLAGQIITENELKKLYGSFEGEKISLIGRRALEPIK